MRGVFPRPGLGSRVLDLGAGPGLFCTRLHISRDPSRHPDTSGYFNSVNRNKRSVALDLARPEALVSAFLHEGVVARLGDTPGGVWHAAPRLGEHTCEVLGGLLGLGDAELDRYAAAGVLE